MAKLWTLAILCVGYGAWIVLALPREAVVNAIPFVFWALVAPVIDHDGNF
jgi:hypothetical protein